MICCPTTARGGRPVRTRFSPWVQGSFPGLFFNAVHRGTLPLASVGRPIPFPKVGIISLQIGLQIGPAGRVDPKLNVIFLFLCAPVPCRLIHSGCCSWYETYWQDPKPLRDTCRLLKPPLKSTRLHGDCREMVHQLFRVNFRLAPKVAGCMWSCQPCQDQESGDGVRAGHDSHWVS